MVGRGHRERGRVVVTATGEIDVTTAQELYDAIDRAAAANPRATTLIIDVAGVTFMDSSGVKCLLHAYRTMLARRGRVIVRDARPPVMRVLDLVGLGQLFTVYPLPAEVSTAAGATSPLSVGL